MRRWPLEDCVWFDDGVASTARVAPTPWDLGRSTVQWRPPVRRASARSVSRQLTRRAFIAYCAVPVGAAGLLAACAPSTPAPPAATQAPIAKAPTQAPIVTPAPAA